MVSGHTVTRNDGVLQGGIPVLSFRGIGFRIVASLLAIIVFGLGVWITFFQSAGYETTTAVIASIEEDPNDRPVPQKENDRQFFAMVTYTVNGKTYTTRLDTFGPDYKVGGEMKIYYDPKDPSKIHGGKEMGIYAMIIGAALLFFVIFFTILDKRRIKSREKRR